MVCWCCWCHLLISSALKSGLVPVLSHFWLELGTEPVIFITKILELWTGTGKTAPLQSVAVLKPVSIGSELDLDTTYILHIINIYILMAQDMSFGVSWAPYPIVCLRHLVSLSTASTPSSIIRLSSVIHPVICHLFDCLSWNQSFIMLEIK